MAVEGAMGAFQEQGMQFKDAACEKIAANVATTLGMGAVELAEEYEVFHINKGENSNVSMRGTKANHFNHRGSQIRRPANATTMAHRSPSEDLTHVCLS